MSLHFVESFSLIKSPFSRKNGIKIYKSQLVGEPRIELGPPAPKAGVLPLYYSPSYYLYSFNRSEPSEFKNRALCFCNFFAFNNHADFFWKRKNGYFIIINIYLVAKNKSILGNQNKMPHFFFVSFNIFLRVRGIRHQSPDIYFSFGPFLYIIFYKIARQTSYNLGRIGLRR